MFDRDPRLVEDGAARRQSAHQRLAVELDRFGQLFVRAGDDLFVDQARIVDQLCKHHRNGLQRLDLDIVVTARIGMLDGEHAHRALAPDDRHAGEGMEFVLTRFGAIAEIGMRSGLGEVQRLDIDGDRADQPFARAQPGDVDRRLVEPPGGEQFELAIAQEIDRADLAIERLPDDFDDGVELRLGALARSHHLVQAGQNRTGGSSGLGHGADPSAG